MSLIEFGMEVACERGQLETYRRCRLELSAALDERERCLGPPGGRLRACRCEIRFGSTWILRAIEMLRMERRVAR